MKNARLAAFEILHGIFTEAAYSNLALDAALADVAVRDRAFVTRLVYGTVERKLTLSWLIDGALKTKTKPKVKTLLLLGAYQLCFMDNVPSHAVIHETVNLASEVGCAYYKGVINAVLHHLDDNRVDLDTLDDLSLRYSCPAPLIAMWNKHYGEAHTRQILAAMNETPPLFAVPNPCYVDADELAYELFDEGIACETDGALVRILAPIDVRKSRSYRNGLFHMEDKSAYACAKALGAKAGDTVLDVCAAPGGKAFTVAEGMAQTGTVYAFDLHAHRVELIREGAARLGLNNLTAGINDAAHYNEALPQAECVLCDVPCSGFGIIRRKPEIRYKELDSIKELPQLQYEILSTSARYLKRGGRLVYATCTLNKKENEQVVRRFLESDGAFSLVSENTVFPSKDGGDGFYTAVMKKA